MPVGLNLFGPRASVTENKQCFPVIRTLLRHTKPPVKVGFMLDNLVE